MELEGDFKNFFQWVMNFPQQKEQEVSEKIAITGEIMWRHTDYFLTCFVFPEEIVKKEKGTYYYLLTEELAEDIIKANKIEVNEKEELVLYLKNEKQKKYERVNPIVTINVLDALKMTDIEKTYTFSTRTISDQISSLVRGTKVKGKELEDIGVLFEEKGIVIGSKQETQFSLVAMKDLFANIEEIDDKVKFEMHKYFLKAISGKRTIIVMKKKPW